MFINYILHLKESKSELKSAKWMPGHPEIGEVIEK